MNNKLIKGYAKFEDAVLIACLGIMGLVLFAQVLWRYFFNTPIMWSEELSRYLQIWLTFLGLGYGLRNDSHISMILVYNKLPEKIQKVVTILTEITMIYLFSRFVPGAYRFVADQNQIHSSAMEIPMSWVYFVGPLGGVVYCLYALGNIYTNILEIIGKKSMTNTESTAKGGLS